MPVQVNWYEDKKRVVYTCYTGVVSLDDIQVSVDQYAELTQEHAEGIHSLVDLRDVESFPTKLRDLKNINDALANSPDQGFIIIVGAAGIARFLGNLIIQLVNLEYRMVDTMEEADAMLAKIMDKNNP